LKVVNNLKQDVKITYFDRATGFRQARELLDRYDRLSTKVSVAYVDPDKQPQVARAAGVRNYGTIFVNAGAKKEEAKSTSEEELTGAIIRSLKEGERNVCSVKGSGEHTLEDTGRTGFSQAKEALERNNYKTREISLLEKPEAPKDCTILIVAGPRFDYVEPVVNAIRSYVEGGGHLLLMLTPPGKITGSEVAENAALAKVVDEWGVTLGKEIVIDSSGIGQIFGFNEYVPLVANYESHAIVREMKEVATAFPLARPVETKTASSGATEKLFSTTANSYGTLTPDKPDPSKGKKGPVNLAVAGTVKKGSAEGRFVVVGSSLWASNSFLRFNGNRDLFLNMANWLSSDEDLISIRPKDPQNRPLELSRAQMSRVFYFSVIGLPLIIVAAGVGVYMKRR
jgi:ABC-type uncharacterized transport system involved in gliding motility auxiliary subunit